VKLIEVFSSFTPIDTPRLILRELRIEDRDRIYDIFSDPEVTKYYDVVTMKSRRQAESLIKWWSNRFKHHKGIRWGIQFRENGQLVGTCGFSELDSENQLGEIGYDLWQPYWNRGIMSEASRALIHFGFEVMELNRIETWVVVENLGSIQVLRKAGLKSEGILRKRRLWNGIFYDVEMFGLLRSDYLTPPPSLLSSEKGE
jgi:[ribosomal protein S5]-alanine N-acetyltransferase